MRRRRFDAYGFVLLAVSQGCGGTHEIGEDSDSGFCSDGVTIRPSYWTVQSHCPGRRGNYEQVFNDTVVHRYEISITASDYAAMKQDLAEHVANASGDLDALPTPITVPATIVYDGNIWTGVGMRWRGHASLKGAYTARIEKYAFRLEFDYYENDEPTLVNQRFYGFKVLNFSNGYNDASLIRDRIAGNIFRDAGVPTARTAFAAVYLDSGDGLVYLGLYTLIEDPADEMLKAQFGDNRGNLYKPWGNAARWLSLTEIPESQVETFFEKETNKMEGDWSDVMAALTALHAEQSDVVTWRAGLESTFDVQAFLKVLATNQVMVNWDSYGCKHHNYLVYGNPKNHGRLQWIPWDLNEALASRGASNCRDPGSILLEQIVDGDPNSTDFDANWPLIRLLLADKTYRADYLRYVNEVLHGAFAAESVIAAMRLEHELIAPYVVGPEATETKPYTTLSTLEDFTHSFVGGPEALETHVTERHTAIDAVLTENGL
jgi:spore coat protein CotH